MFVSLVRLFALIRHLYSGLGLQSVINLVFDIIQDMGWIHIGLQSDIPFFLGAQECSSSSRFLTTNSTLLHVCALLAKIELLIAGKVYLTT